MNRKKQYENQVTDLASGHVPAFSVNSSVILQYVNTTDAMPQACSYHVLYCSGQEGYQPWLMKNTKHFSSCSILWSLCKRQDLYWPKPLR